jgi:hypothetical protein
MTNHRIIPWALLLLLALQGCGGGGDDPEPEPAAAVDRTEHVPTPVNCNVDPRPEACL